MDFKKEKNIFIVSSIYQGDNTPYVNTKKMVTVSDLRKELWKKKSLSEVNSRYLPY